MTPRTEQFKKRGRKARSIMGPRLLSTMQLAEYLGMSTAKTTVMITEGLIPGRIKMTGVRRTFFDRKVIDKWIDEGAPSIDIFENGKYISDTWGGKTK